MWPPQYTIASRSVDVAPHGQEAAVGIEQLDAVALAVNDVHPLILVEGDVMGSDELAGVDARLAQENLYSPSAVYTWMRELP